MPDPDRAQLQDVPANLHATPLSSWVAGTFLYGLWLTSLLDAQTTSWRQLERHTANLMQFWFDPGVPPPSAQPLVDAAQGIAPLGPAALQRAWSGWLQVWAGAMRHDAAGG